MTGVQTCALPISIRDYIHVVDLVDAHVRALEHLMSGGASAALNLGDSRSCRWGGVRDRRQPYGRQAVTCLIGASDEKPEVSADLDTIGAARERTRRAVQPSGSARS